MRRRIPRLTRSRVLAAFFLFVVAAGALGLLSHGHGGVTGTIVHGFSCIYHGAKAWLALKRHHPGWSAYHLFMGTHQCRETAWAYRK